MVDYKFLIELLVCMCYIILEEGTGYRTSRGKKTGYNLYAIILEEGTGYRTGRGGWGIIYMLLNWRKVPDIKLAEGEDGVKFLCYYIEGKYRI